ncbi:MAG: methyl-accepting chemotaxis protein [Chloroflexota bacterium]
MTTWLWDTVAPPTFAEDEDKTRIASILNITLMALIIVTPVACLALTWLNPENALFNLAIGVVLTLGFFGLRAMMYKGQVRGAGAILSSILWVAITMMPIISNTGLDDPVLTGYFLVVALASLLVGDRATVIFGLASILGMVSIFFVQTQTEMGVSSPVPVVTLIVFIIMLGLVTNLFRFAVYQMLESLQRARYNEQAQSEANQELENIRASLEQRAAREQALVQKYVAYMAQVGQGNLALRVNTEEDGANKNDPLLTLGDRLNETVANLHEMTVQVRDAATNLSTVVAELLAATTQQAAGANEQSSAIAQTTETIEEIKTIVDQSLDKAKLVAEQSQHITQVSQRGQKAVVETIASMNQIKDKVSGIAENILALSEQSQQIGEIITTVNDLASQSNLLALNASVEAARAGEQGRGFAVVAAEVRNLAEQSKRATSQVRDILNEIQRATNAAVLATEEGTKGVDSGTDLAQQTGETIQQLVANITESVNAAQQILASAQQQTTGVEQISLAMQSINQATVQNLASTRQAEKAAQDLSSLAHQMENLVDRYKLN